MRIRLYWIKMLVLQPSSLYITKAKVGNSRIGNISLIAGSKIFKNKHILNSPVFFLVLYTYQ